jgi:hypothetical protein
MKYFNISGTCNNIKQYMTDASIRLQGVKHLIVRKQYFVIHPATQSGKTTYLQDFTKRLNVTGKYYALYCSLEEVPDLAFEYSQKMEFAKDAN